MTVRPDPHVVRFKEAQAIVEKLHAAIEGHSMGAILAAVGTFVLSCPEPMGSILRQSLGMKESDEATGR